MKDILHLENVVDTLRELRILDAKKIEKLETLLEAAKELVEFKGPCLDGFVRHVGDHYVEALEDAIKEIEAMK